MNRHAELDTLRGLLLVLMTVTHLPTRYSVYSSQLFGFASAAEGFVFLSGLVAGLVYWRLRREQGEAVLTQRLRRRAWQLYLAHLALLAFLFTVGAALGHFGERPMLRNLLSFYFEQPLVALWAGPALLYQPPLLDILPTYILLLLGTGFWLRLADRRGWGTVLAQLRHNGPRGEVRAAVVKARVRFSGENDRAQAVWLAPELLPSNGMRGVGMD